MSDPASRSQQLYMTNIQENKLHLIKGRFKPMCLKIVKLLPFDFIVSCLLICTVGDFPIFVWLISDYFSVICLTFPHMLCAVRGTGSGISSFSFVVEATLSAD